MARMAHQNSRRWTTFVRSSLYEGKLNEDNERNEELAFFVVCEDQDGNRYSSKLSFSTEDFSRKEAEARALRLEHFTKLALTRGGDPTASPKWYLDSPMYGSAAWTNYGEAAELARERKEVAH